jgi:hypothetical protein
MFIVFLFALLPSGVYAQFPTNYNSSTVNVARLSADWNDFNWQWRGWDDQSCRLLFTNNGAQFLIADYGAAFQVVRDNTLFIYVFNTNITKYTDHANWGIAHTNIPPYGIYKAEFLIWSGILTNYTRSIARGKITVLESLYSNTNLDTYPFPQITFGNTIVTNETDPIYSASAASGVTAGKIAAFF